MAEGLLEASRQTIMRRGAISQGQSQLKAEIARVINEQGTPAALAARIAFQLVFKFGVAELGDSTIWAALGQLLQRETVELKVRIGLTERQTITVLPKLSARQVKNLLEELQTTDRRIARTILNAAIEAAEPITAGRRYLAEYRRVAEQLQAVDPTVARTLANATFTARAPHRRAMDHFKQFANLILRFKDDVDFARVLAKATFRAPDPLKAAEAFIAEYHCVVAALASNGVEPHIARTLASSSRFRKSFRSGPAST